MRLFSDSSPTGRLLAVTALAVVAFLVANALLAHETRSIERFGRSVAANAAPSVERLANARTVLFGLESSLGLALGEAGEGRAPDPALFEREQMRLQGELSAYLALPFYPGERELYGPIQEGVTRFGQAIDRTLSLIARGDLPAARTAFRTEAIPDAHRASQAIQAVIDFDVAQVRWMNLDMVSVRRTVTILSWTLDALALGVAAVLIWLTLRAVRAYSRLAEERQLRAEVRARELEQFAGRIAHDLKNPLGSLTLRLEVLRRRVGDEAVARLSPPIQSMSRMIDDLLAFAVAGAQPKPGSADLREVVDEVASLLREEAASVETELDTSGCARARVAMSRGSLVSVVSNLVHNALKFIVQSSAPRRVTVRSSEPRRGRIRLEIEDTGPGLTPGAEHTIFEPFVRGGGQVDGFGIGLATVKRLVEGSGGTVGVESHPGRGALFLVELARATEAQVEASPAKEPPAHEPPAPSPNGEMDDRDK